MYRNNLYLSIAVLVLPIVLSSCSTSKSTTEYAPSRIPALVDRFENDPTDSEAISLLGIIAFHQSRFEKAGSYLEQAYALNQEDARTCFYYGLYHEQIGLGNDAIPIYARYNEMPLLSPYRGRMRGRFETLARAQARFFIRNQEPIADSLIARIDSNAVAVFPLKFQGGNREFESLGHGLSAMIINDLAKIGSLSLVERVYIQAILDELQLASSEYVDPDTAPRLGYFLGAGRIVGGGYTVTESDILRLNIALMQGTEDIDVPPDEAMVNQLFELQNSVVFRLADKMGIELTQTEREAIEYIPTRNLQALIAYSQGVAAQDQGNYSEAAAHFRTSFGLDNQFNEAIELESINRDMETVEGTVSEVLSNMGIRESLRALRQKQLAKNLGMLIGTDPEARDPAPEAANSSDGGFLQTPPTPPTGNQ